MNTISWKGKAFKQLSFGKKKSGGRNSSGSITIFHRGGGSKRKQRRVDFLRNTLSTGIVERIEYDPNRSSRIALIRWFNSQLGVNEKQPQTNLKKGAPFFSYILACDQLKLGDEVMNLHLDSTKLVQRAERFHISENTEVALAKVTLGKGSNISNRSAAMLEDRQLYQKIGTNTPLSQATLGSFLHNIESYPGVGGKLVRSAGTFAQLVQKFEDKGVCLVRLPSGRQYLLDLQCRATVGVVSNTSHNTQKLTKAGQSRWLRRRPVVRGVAMNPIDHPHGGGEGRTKGGRPSVSPWGKPTKGCFTKRRDSKTLRGRSLRDFTKQ